MIDPQIISELFVNLAAGWIGAIIIFPVTLRVYKFNLTSLLFDILSAILSLVAASYFKGLP